MQKYNSYKPTRLNWIGEIPSQWGAIPLKYIASIAKGKKAKEDYQDYSDGLIPYLSMEYLRNQTVSPMYVKADDDSVVLVDENDLLILWDGSKSGEIVKAKNGALSSTMGKIHIEDKSFNLDYLTYFLKCAEPFLQSNTIGMGIPHVDGEILRDLLIVKPTIQEQIQITNFLDHQTNVIDNLIVRKEKLIQLLKEKRQSVINEAVTKGLNPDAKMKDSGIEWLGMIPEHWQIARIGHYTQLIRGASPRPAGDPRYFGGTYMPWITVGEVTNGNEKYLTSTENYLTKEGSELSRIIYPETLLLSNSGATLGVPKISKITGCINDGSVAFIGFSEQLKRDFLYYFFKTHTEIYRQEMSGYGQPNLNTDIIKSTFFPLPPINEQELIIDFIENQFLEFDKIISMSIFQLEKLKEYRQSVITEVVTGKVNVSEWQKSKNIEHLS
jgi:type I restriction enzyme S subunit